MSVASTSAVREGLQAYADRKIFRNFKEEKGKDGKTKFTFLYLGDKTVTLEYTEKDHTLVIRNMLPRVSASMFADLEAFLEDLFDAALPAYRRIERSSAEVHFVKKGANVSLVFQVKRNQYRYGVDKIIDLISWIHIYLQREHQEYLWRVMGEPED